MQSGYSYELPLVDAELCDILISLHILCSPLFDSGPRVEIKHLKEQGVIYIAWPRLGRGSQVTIKMHFRFLTLHINSTTYFQR